MEMTTQELTCKNDDCTMTFTCEDQLVAHEKRHEMGLTLGPLKGNLFNSDQTPTPTRFIRNCDEVGLFQDLQNVNPFEETFRRAVEQNKNGETTLSTPLSNALNDDTLHTPHIFPNFNNISENAFIRISDEHSASNIDANPDSQKQSNLSKNVSRSESISDNTSLNINKQTNINSTVITSNPIDVDNITISKEALPIPKVNHIININRNSILLPVLEQIHISNEVAEQIIASNSLPLQNQTTINEISCVKKQLKESILKNTQQTVIESTPILNRTNAINSHQSASSIIAPNNCPLTTGLRNILPKKIPELKRQLSDKTCSKIKIKTQKFKEHDIFQKKKVVEKQQLTNNNNKIQSKNNDDEQRQQFLARNRAAASRWRVKKREQIRELIRRNQQLEYENTTLKTECAELKKMLLTHKNCSLAIPQSMITGPGVTVSSLTSPNNQSSTINSISKITITNNLQSINVSLNM